MGRYYFGDVVLLCIDDGKGNSKERPALVITPDRECDAGFDLRVIAISATLKDPLPDYHVTVHGSNSTD